MFEDFEYWVDWLDPESARVYESGPGPFRVVHAKNDLWVAVCTCGGKGGGLLDDGHSPRCAVHRGPVKMLALILEMSGRLRSFSEDLFKPVQR